MRTCLKKSLLIPFVKKISVILFCSFLCFYLSACGYGTPSKKQLKDMIPSEILSYELEGDLHMSEITDLEIIRQQTNEKSDIAECTLTLTDEYLRRTVYITLVSTYWDTGGWMLESYEVTQSEEYEIIGNMIYDPNMFQSQINMLGYQSTDKTCIEEENGYSEYIFTVAEQFPYLSYTGDIAVMAQLQQGNNMEGETTYYWETYIDTSDISYSWSITGHWRAEEIPSMNRGLSFERGKSWAELQIYDADTTYYNMDDTYNDHYYSYKLSYEEIKFNTPSIRSGEKTTGKIMLLGSDKSDMHLKIGPNTINWGVECVVEIYPSYAQIAVAEYMDTYGSFVPLEKIV